MHIFLFFTTDNFYETLLYAHHNSVKTIKLFLKYNNFGDKLKIYSNYYSIHISVI